MLSVNGRYDPWLDALIAVLRERLTGASSGLVWEMTYAELGRLPEQLPHVEIDIDSGPYGTEATLHLPLRLVPESADDAPGVG